MKASEDIDFIVRGEFDYAVVEFAQGKPLGEIAGVSYRKDGEVVHNPPRPALETEALDRLPFVTSVYKRDLASKTTTCRSCSTLSWLYTARGAVRRSARFACGRKRFPGTPGAFAPPRTWRRKSARP